MSTTPTPVTRASAEPDPVAEPTVHDVTLRLCSLCLDGAGGECHVPGCVMWLNRAPDLAIRNHPMVTMIDGKPSPAYADRIEVPHLFPEVDW